MRRFYDANIDLSANSHQLSEEESKHIVRVLRMKIGDKLILLNGFGVEIEAKIISDHPKRCEVEFTNVQQHEKPAEEIHIALCPTKQMERIEWFVEKATEIGITKISFLSTKNSERVNLKIDRILKKAVSAMKQSQRVFLPEISEIIPFNQFLETNPNGLIAHCENGEKESISNVISKQDCPVLIGPEGDFTSEEIKKALESGYKSITLGENRLRTETAALYACMQVKMRVSN